MNSNIIQTLLLEILRVGLITIRNLSEAKDRGPEGDEKLKQWTNLCHTIPSILLGRCSERAVRYFLQRGMAPFFLHYPAPEDADFGLMVNLQADLKAALEDSSPA